MSSLPGVEQTLELLNRLKSTVQEFTARENELTQEFRLRNAREQQQREESIAAAATRLEAQLNEESAAFESAKSAAKSTYEKRKAKISKARTTSKEQTLERIENRTGARKYELQKRLMQAERDRDSGLTNAAAAFEDFRNNLLAEEEQLARLEAKARASFRGYWSFRRLLTRVAKGAEPDLTKEDQQLLAEFRKLLKDGADELGRFRRLPLPMLFRFLPPWLLLPLCAVPVLPFILQHYGIKALAINYSLQTGEALTAGLAVLIIALHLVGKQTARPLASRVANSLGKARGLYDACLATLEARYQNELQRVENAFKETTQNVEQELKAAMKDNLAMKGTFRETIDDKTVRITVRNDATYRARLQELERIHVDKIEWLKKEASVRESEANRVSGDKEARMTAEQQARWQTLESEWKEKIAPLYEDVKAANAEAAALFPPWQKEMVERWTPPTAFTHAAKFGQLEVNVEKLCEGLPKDKRLTLPGPVQFPLPLSLVYPHEGSVLFEMMNFGVAQLIGALNNIVLRLLMSSPPGRLNFTIIDPVGLGQNFAGIMHLADYEAQLINSRIWTQPNQIEQRLADLNEHMEKVIQMYLRNEYATIAEYNQQAGNIAEKYHFLVVADFPANFTEQAVKRLMSIAVSGARCGVYTLIHWDQRQPMPPDFQAKDLRKSCVSINATRGNELVLTGKFMPGTSLTLDPPPSPELAIEFVHKLGKSSRDSSRVEVPFEHVAPPDNEVWSLDTTSELRVPIGRTGATKLQYLAIGKGTRQHALIAGKTGSGKSTLFHVVITNLAMWTSPEQVEFYLVDFKKGVEFKCYAAKRLPHARVVAIESDREFGLSVLQRVDDELKRRGDLFRKFGAQDIAGYKRAGGKEAIPRSLLMIDEFQEFFVEDDKISQTASVLLDRIVRQGRAFGIHVILGSQTLGGAYTLARTTLGQMVIRIALQCNEADAYLIMDENNPAPRLLSRPGEGIYNDTAGSVEGNSPFQVVWLPDEVRDNYLGKVRERADHAKTHCGGPVVFEGNAPADVRDNELLRDSLDSKPTKAPVSARIWLGAPNSIKGPTEAVFHRQSGNHLIIVGQREEAAMAILGVSLISLSAQYPKDGVKFFVFDGNPPGTPQREFMESIAKIVPHEITMVKTNELADVMNGLAADLKQRTEDANATAPATFLVFHGLQKFNKLRHEDDFSMSADEGPANPSAQLGQLIAEGASHGIHVIVTLDSYNNVNRFMSRKSLGEFEMRVLFQMSANDSASLIDNPKAGTLGLHRALFYNEQEGYLETFRPYALPDEEWIKAVGNKLAMSAT